MKLLDRLEPPVLAILLAAAVAHTAWRGLVERWLR
jgi:hypothetical protein